MKKIFYFCAIAASVSLYSCCDTKKLASEHNDLADTYENLKDSIPDATVTFDNERVKLVLPESLLFGFDSYEITNKSKGTVSKVAKILKKYPKTSVLVTGYTDITGTVEYNNQLSLKRAQATKSELVKDGIADGRIYTWGLGPKDPIADNNTEAGRKQNRRVEFVILYNYNKK